MASSTIERDAAKVAGDWRLNEHVRIVRRGNVVMMEVSNYPITDTSARTNLGTLPSSELNPPFGVFAFGISPNLSYVTVSSNGQIQGYMNVQGNLLATISWGVN